MTAIKINYGTEAQAVTITLSSLATSSARQSVPVDNTSNVFLDALVMAKIVSSTAGTAATGYVNVYAFGTVNSTTPLYTDGATTSDAAITMTSPPNMRLIGVLNVVATASTYIGGPWSVAPAFGGVLPSHWGVVVENKSGGNLDSTATAHGVYYQGISAQTS